MSAVLVQKNRPLVGHGEGLPGVQLGENRLQPGLQVGILLQHGLETAEDGEPQGHILVLQETAQGIQQGG